MYIFGGYDGNYLGDFYEFNLGNIFIKFILFIF